MSSAGSNWLILGGCGFIGRNLVTYLVNNKLATKIRVADKSMPATSAMNATHKAIFEQKDIVEFKQADLSKDDHVNRVFTDFHVDYVVNLCGETKFGLNENEYKTKILDTATKVGAAAVKAKVQKFVEISTAQIYNPDKSPSNEDQKQKPWTVQAKFRLQAEEALSKLQKEQDLRLVILRPALVYGVGDLTSITPRIACAAVYQKLGEKMKFLWDKDLRLNVVHVDDVVRAIVAAATEFNPGTVYNLADQSELTQGQLNEYLGKIFKIETGFLGSIVSNLAKLNLGGVAEEANDKHVPGFTKLCDEHKINNTPISAYIDKELLSNNHLSIDGRRITQQTKFTYTRQCDEKAIREQIDAAIEQGIFPKVVSI